ncbi:MAG: hypothetical protein HFJ17_00760 [Clostridia bacterium]|nr:hypothetical protein [Clostridia bacterium]
MINADSTVKDFLNGKLKYDENIHCDHHEHNEHSCNIHEDKHGCSGNK